MSRATISLILLSVSLPFIASSCATSRGFGQDLQKVGNRIEAEADESGGATPSPSATGLGPSPAPPSTGLRSPYSTPVVPPAY